MEKTLHETPEEGDVIEVVFQNSTSVFVVLKAEVVAWSTHHLSLDLLYLIDGYRGSHVEYSQSWDWRKSPIRKMTLLTSM